MPSRKLDRSFYNQDTLTVARGLLGKNLIHASRDGITVGEIVETEAYIGPDDAASHAYRGLRTPRTDVQFGPGGFAYVFSVYGVHDCFCVVTEPEGKPGVVLIRALRPVFGINLMARRHGISLDGLTSRSLHERVVSLCNGPSKLCRAMGITKSEHYGSDLGGAVLYIEEGSGVDPSHVAITKRINIDYAGEAKEYPWRFCICDCEFVSAPVCSVATR